MNKFYKIYFWTTIVTFNLILSGNAQIKKAKFSFGKIEIIDETGQATHYYSVYKENNRKSFKSVMKIKNNKIEPQRYLWKKKIFSLDLLRHEKLDYHWLILIDLDHKKNKLSILNILTKPITIIISWKNKVIHYKNVQSGKYIYSKIIFDDASITKIIFSYYDPSIR